MKVYRTKEEFTNEQNKETRKRIRAVLNNWLDNTNGKEVFHDSDIEDLKFALEEIGVDITWKALYDFLGIWKVDFLDEIKKCCVWRYDLA